MKTCGEQLKSNMEWSHINNEHNDGKDNDLESLGEGHSSHSQRKMTKRIQKMQGLRKAHIRTSINTHTR